MEGLSLTASIASILNTEQTPVLRPQDRRQPLNQNIFT
jgi:hypothetical protein